MRFQLRGVYTLGLAALVMAGCSAKSAQPPVASAPTMTIPTATSDVAEVTYQVQRGEVTEILQLAGRVTAARDQDVFFTEDGYIKSLAVQRNDTVASGQLLAELDLGPLADQLEQARADYAALQRSIASTQQQRGYSVASARLALQTAQDNLARAQRPPSDMEIKAAQDKLDRARITLENTRNSASAAKTNANLEVERAANNLRNRQAAYSQVAWENGDRPLEELEPLQRANQEQALRAVEDAENELRLAQVAYDLAVQNEINAIALAERDIQLADRELADLQAGPDPIDVRTAERAVQSAQLNLQMALANQGNPEMATRLEQAQNAIAELEQKAAASQIYAPFDGVVAEVGVKLGDQVEAYMPVVNVSDPSQFVLVVTNISTDDLARIAPGQPVAITFARYPDQTISGIVEQLPSDQVSAGSQVRADPLLRIAFDRQDLQFEIGDPADVTITFRQEPEALWLPPQALNQFDQRTFVILQDGDQRRQVDIETGISSPDRVQIRAGLEEGDVVIGASTAP